MQEESGFKHISVSEDDDEIVIQAGAVSAKGDSLQAAQVPSHEEIEDEAEGEASPFERELTEEEREEIRHEAERERRAARAEANRMITTEEDLKAGTPFAGMRRVILVVAALLILVAVAYYNLAI